jgi:hypothetical protein
MRLFRSYIAPPFAPHSLAVCRIHYGGQENLPGPKTGRAVEEPALAGMIVGPESSTRNVFRAAAGMGGGGPRRSPPN